MRFHVYHYLDPVLERKLDRVFNALLHNQEKIMALLDTLTADLSANTDATNSIITLVNTIVAELKALQASGTVDPVALKALTDKLEANTAEIAAAVTANTSTTPAA